MHEIHAVRLSKGSWYQLTHAFVIFPRANSRRRSPCIQLPVQYESFERHTKLSLRRDILVNSLFNILSVFMHEIAIVSVKLISALYSVLRFPERLADVTQPH